MGLLSNPLFGTPRKHSDEKQDHEVVKTPEFDITQYAKKLGLGIGILLAAAIAALKAAKVEEVTDPVVLVGVLGVTAAGLLGMSLVMAIDIASRAFLSGEGSAKESKEKEGERGQAVGSKAIAMPPGTLVWLQGDERPLPLLAVSEAGDSYLVASGETYEAGRTGQGQQAIKGAPKWEAAEKVAALKPPKWRA